MRTFWLFRSNIRDLEYYHQYTDLSTFKKNCHDYYMLLPLWLLEKNYFDQVIVWRLSNKKIKDIIFTINNKQYIQKWVPTFKETLDFPSPDISFWRGGFPEYDEVTKINSKHFGLKLYLGAGRRIFPMWNGRYDAFLIEDERDFIKNSNCFFFYKTASPNIFFPIENEQKKWDICWPCNFTQIKYKGQKFFLSQISKHKELQELNIVHCGNKPEVGKELCKRFGIKNIIFKGSISRSKLNKVLNQSKFGLNLSNITDGCPRVSTEILMSGTPLLISSSTRLLRYFKQYGVVIIKDKYFLAHFVKAIEHYDLLKEEVLKAINTNLSFDNINKKNIETWQKI